MFTAEQIINDPAVLAAMDPIEAAQAADQMAAAAARYITASDLLWRHAIAGMGGGAVRPATADKGSDHVLTPREAARRLGRHHSWFNRHGRKYRLLVIDPGTGRALGVSARALDEFIRKGCVG